MSEEAPIGAGIGPDVGEYCRQVEAHLARVNAGEIIRITGAGFELVRGWALAGIPLSIVCHAISLKAERHRTGRSTRPLRIEFCATDVRDVFTTWRRAVGVTAAVEDVAGPAAPSTDEPKRPSLGKHLQRALDRLSLSASQSDLDPPVRDVLERTLRDLAAIADRARGARGAARETIVAELAALDARLVADARTAIGPPALQRLAGEAEVDLSAYRDRLSPETWQRTVDLGVTRLLRDRLGLPIIEL